MNRRSFTSLGAIASLAIALMGPASSGADDGVTRIPLLPPGPGNPRNSEGAFLRLKHGRILFVYTHFTGGAGDHAPAHLASRSSGDGGLTWTTYSVRQSASLNFPAIPWVLA